ncbi:nucleotidyltransferase family protein [Terasakiella sp. SH-1]|uniref:nucleotidyltransferase family protein n=1 Tax=Terasakiella sp. SH-1 TaxID=2560057 RepID=UPI001073572C|nr:nucleotidyltransferase family protein [Terasakiella sp. SH-1]
MSNDELNRCFISMTSTLQDALLAIENSKYKIALIVDMNQKLLGTITDGDIRRVLLKNSDFTTPCHQIMNNDPTIAHENDSKATLLHKMTSYKRRHLPVIDKYGKVVSVVTLQNLIATTSRPNTIFIMAGGFGKRLLPLTKETPKPMLPIGDKPILEHILDRFIASGFDNFIISVHYHAEIIKEYFQDGSNWDVNISYVEENEPKGTAGALGLIKDKNTLPMIVVNGDVLTEINFGHLLDFHNDHASNATMCVGPYKYEIPFGVVETKDGKLIKFREKPIFQHMINAGMYVVSPQLLDLITPGEYIDMPDLFTRGIKNGLNTCVFPIHEQWIDIGRPEDYNLVK